MTRIAYILLCHKDPEAVILQALRMTAAGDAVAIHFDGRAPRAAYRRLRDGLSERPGVIFAPRRVRCGWGEWSLVRASLETLRAARDAFPDATHFYLMSGDCMPIKSAEYAHDFLQSRDADYIESEDFFTSGWIRTGWVEERLIYRHWVNERTQRRLFYALFDAQRRLGLTRSPPAGLRMRIGSQWWCLRRGTVDRVLRFVARRPDVVRFFRTTWIPDETFFQTLVRHLVPSEEIESRTLTFLLFSDYGMPVSFHDDHYDLLLSQSHLFARKISPEAGELKRRLGVLYPAGGVSFSIADEGAALYRFVTGQGRTGARFAPRVWERESSLGRERELLIVICKDWPLGLRVATMVAQAAGVRAIGYLFDDMTCDLPPLGGIETPIGKRHRHRRALLRMLYEHHGTDRLLICIDPGSFDVIADFGRDVAVTRMLSVETALTDPWLRGHAERTRLAGPGTPDRTLARILPTIRNGIEAETARLRDAGFPALTVLREGDAPASRNAALAGFAGLEAVRDGHGWPDPFRRADEERTGHALQL